MKYLLMVLVLLIVVIIYSTLSQPGVNDLRGDFREIDAWQNENNTGPVRRTYIVTLSDTLWKEMEAYGNYMPYAKMGTTDVWFFLADKPYPSKVRVRSGVPFSAIYQQTCIGLYGKSNMGVVRLQKYPFQ